MEPCGTTLRIAAADRFRLDFLKRIFRTDLAEAARAVAGTELALEFVIDPAIAAATNIVAAEQASGDAAPENAPASSPTALPAATTAPIASMAPVVAPESSAASEALRTAATAAPMPEPAVIARRPAAVP